MVGMGHGPEGQLVGHLPFTVNPKNVLVLEGNAQALLLIVVSD